MAASRSVGIVLLAHGHGVAGRIKQHIDGVLSKAERIPCLQHSARLASVRAHVQLIRSLVRHAVDARNGSPLGSDAVGRGYNSHALRIARNRMGLA